MHQARFVAVKRTFCIFFADERGKLPVVFLKYRHQHFSR